MTKGRILKLFIRLGLFTLILGLGTMTALVMDETKGLALADLSDTSVQTMTAAAGGQTLYANLIDDVRPSGLYRSDDSGRTWQVVSAGPGLVFNTLLVDRADESILYAGTAGGPLGATNNVWRSTDGGQSWQNFNLSLPANPDHIIPAVTAVIAAPDQPGVLYVGTDGHGVYRFVDGQLGYELVGGISLAEAHVKELVAGADSRLYALTNGGLFVTGGDVWQKIETLPEVPVSLAVTPTDPQQLFAGSPSRGLYRTTDGGQSWDHIGDGLGLMPGASLRATALTVDEQDPDHVVVATAYGLGSQIAPAAIYQSHDAGQTWTEVAEIDSLVKKLTLNQGIILAATDNGFERYGEPVEPSPTTTTPAGLRLLAQPTGSQTLILALTISLAGIALIGRPEWVSRRRRVTNEVIK